MKVTDINKEVFTTTQESCNILVDLLVYYGVENAIISPGSRNAPIITALSRCEKIKKYIIVDERSAAFAALGMAQTTDKPVAIVCTSGSAVLNYAPAVAEAFYQRIPLIVISADRPHEWIDQNDSQTLMQAGILNNIVKHSYDIPADSNDKTSQWYINRTINEALQKAISIPKGPVHLNMQFKEPLYERKPLSDSPARPIRHIQPLYQLPDYSEFANAINSHKKVLILASMHKPCNELTSILDKISGGNIVVISEIIANNHTDKRIFKNIDRLLTEINDENYADFAPDLLITFGGAPVSRLAKTFLRKSNDIEHWRIGIDNNIIDTMQNLTHRIDTEPLSFFKGISQHLTKNGTYFEKWVSLKEQARLSHEAYIENAQWSDMIAMHSIMNDLPANGLNLQVSNGSAIRYADIMGVPEDFTGTVSCNRGVSGIDGSTSTALGASMAYTDGDTLLITGDMSFSYDLNGLASQYNSERLKIIVLCNGGGGIFRFINGPTSLPDFEQYFEVHRDIPIEKYADAFGFNYISAKDKVTLQESLHKLFSNSKPTILAIFTNNKISADTLRGYFNRNNIKKNNIQL